MLSTRLFIVFSFHWLVISYQLQLQPFAKRADFGIVDHTVSSLQRIIKEELRCTENLQFCHVRDAAIIHNKLLLKTSIDYDSLLNHPVHKMNLVSWYKELLESDLAVGGSCGSKRGNVLLVKTDILYNIYHHMGTLLSAYFSRLIVLKLLPSDKDDLTIVLWDDRLSYTTDAIVKFLPLWRALLGDVILSSDLREGVCVKNLYLGLPPRRWGGVGYNAVLPDIPPKGSGLVQQFGTHVLSSLSIPLTTAGPSTVLWISRTTPTRRVLNEDVIVGALREKGFAVTVVDMAQLSLVEQLTLVVKHRVLVGVHGAGLTHVIFCRGCVLVELYNCEEEACYRDLAKLSGSHYITQPRHDVEIVYPSSTEGPRTTKNANFVLKVAHVVKMVEEAVGRVRDEL